MRMLLAAAVTAAILLPAAAQAAMCVDVDRGHRLLVEQYDEQPVGRGVSDGRLVLLYTSSDGGTWTVVTVDPNHKAICILAAGESWDAVAAKAPGQPS